MQIDREFHDMKVITFLSQLDEKRLLEIIEEYEIDNELSSAMVHSQKDDGYENMMPARKFMKEKSFYTD